MYLNLYKIENEDLKRKVENMKENENKKETEHSKKVQEMNKKMQLIKQENLIKCKCKQDIMEVDIETESDIKVHECNACGFKTNWRTNMKTHKCKKVKKKK